MNTPSYYIVAPEERDDLIKIVCLCVVFGLITVGMFLGACYCARSKANGLTVSVEVHNAGRP